jgi:hypothetical protein
MGMIDPFASANTFLEVRESYDRGQQIFDAKGLDMCKQFRPIGRIIVVLVLSLVCLSYSRADNILSGSGALPVTFSFDATGSNCAAICGGSIQNFGPNSLNGSMTFWDSFSFYSEAPLPSGGTAVSATIGSGRITLGLGGYSFAGQIYSGSMDGYYCRPFDPSCCCQHVNGLVETTVYFSGNWMIPHFPQPEFWPGHGHFYVAEQHFYGSWVNCNLFLNGCMKPPSTIWIDTQVPASTPEPSTLVLLGSSLLGVAGALRRRRML